MWLQLSEVIGDVPASRLRENLGGLQTTESTVLNYIDSECTFRSLFFSFFFSFLKDIFMSRSSMPFTSMCRNPATPAGAYVHVSSSTSPGWPAGSPLTGPLLGGVVRADDLRLWHHSVLVLREGIAVWNEHLNVRSSGPRWTKTYMC